MFKKLLIISALFFAISAYGQDSLMIADTLIMSQDSLSLSDSIAVDSAIVIEKEVDPFLSLPVIITGSKSILSKDTLPANGIYNWKYSADDGELYRVPVDTIDTHLFLYNPIFKKSISNTYLGNLGSPYISNIISERDFSDDFLFKRSFKAYMWTPERFRFINTRNSYTNLTYMNGGSKRQSEEMLAIVFSRNAGEYWNFTGQGEVLYGRGMYANQSTKDQNYSFLTSYIRDKYHMHLILSSSTLENFENGGFTNDLYISDPYKVTDSRGTKTPEDFPTNFTNVDSRLKNRFVHFNQKYYLGRYQYVDEDSSSIAYRPFAGIVHTFHSETSEKDYNEKTAAKKFYEAFSTIPLIDSVRTRDKATEQLLTNTLGVFWEEGATDWSKFGLGAFVGHRYTRNSNKSGHHLAPEAWYTSADTLAYNYSDTTFNDVWIGAKLFKHRGDQLFFNSTVSYFLFGRRETDYRITGDLRYNFNKDDSTFLSLLFNHEKKAPDFFMEHYYSNHFYWDNNFESSFRFDFQARLDIKRLGISLSGKYTKEIDPIYFGENATPVQSFGEGVNVLELGLGKLFKLGHFNFDNRFIYQKSTNESIMPVPDYAVYAKWYYRNTFFKVLDLSVGFEGRYNSAFYAPAYMPATSQFYLQNEVEIGDAPIINPFINFHLKRMRFFVKMYHANQGIGELNYFSAPHYANNPRFIKYGLSWNFYD